MYTYKTVLYSFEEYGFDGTSTSIEHSTFRIENTVSLNLAFSDKSKKCLYFGQVPNQPQNPFQFFIYEEVYMR